VVVAIQWRATSVLNLFAEKMNITMTAAVFPELRQLFKSKAVPAGGIVLCRQKTSFI